MKNIIGRLCAVWALVVFFITLWVPAFILWVIGLVPEPRRTKIFRATVFVWMRLFMFLTGCRFKRKGIRNFRRGKNYIVTCNHNSFMDVPAATPFIPGANKTIAKIELSKIPVFGLIYRRGSVLVNRKSKDSRKDSFLKMKQVLKLGMHMCIYPEGSRNKTDQPLTPFHDGAFKLAVETGTAIIPAVIFNTRKAMPADKGFYFRPANIQIHFLPEIPVNKDDDFTIVRELVYNTMEVYYAENAKKLSAYFAG